MPAAPSIVRADSAQDSPCSTLGNINTASETEAHRACQKVEQQISQIKDVKRSQVLAIPHREEDEDAENHATWSMTSICSFGCMPSVPRFARFFEEDYFSDCDDFRSTTGSEDDIAERLMFRSDDED